MKVTSKGYRMKDADEKVKDEGLRWENNKGEKTKVQENK